MVATFRTAPDLDVGLRLSAVMGAADQALTAAASDLADELLSIGEAILARWLVSRRLVPTAEVAEGFRLLALHRQGAIGDPSFNACRESCRELVYYRNLIRLEPDHPDVARRVRLAAMVANHLGLFIDGKLERAGFGEFCCSSRSLRQRDTMPPTITGQE